MRIHFFPNKDASIFEEYPNKQCGLDEILEVGKSDHGSYKIRSLLSFDITDVSNKISTGVIPPSASFDLKLFLANASRVKNTQEIELRPLSQSWTEGSGYFYQDSFYETDGVTWRSTVSGSTWTVSGSSFLTSSVSSSTTLPIGDVTFDVTTFVRQWVSGTIPNYGMVVKYPTADESSSINQGRLFFFSKDTHTVFLPVLVAKWDDQQYSTGSLTAVSSQSFVVYPFDLKKRYKQNELVTVNIVAKELYPRKTFSNIYSYTGSNYVPTSSYFSIVDVQSNEIIIPFDSYSKISVSPNGNYVNFRTDKMYPMRHYKMMVKVINSQTEQIFDDNYVFGIDQ